RDRNVTGVQTCALPIWSQYLDHYGPVTDIVHDVPELAYWTPGQIARWRNTFLDERSTYRRGHIAHPYMGVLLCFSCGSPMQSCEIGRASCREREESSDV